MESTGKSAFIICYYLAQGRRDTCSIFKVKKELFASTSSLVCVCVCVCVKIAQSCLTLCNLMDYIVCGIL